MRPIQGSLCPIQPPIWEIRDEVFPCTGANKYGLIEDIEVDDRGLVYAPTGPGLGYEIDWELVKREHTATVD